MNLIYVVGKKTNQHVPESDNWIDGWSFVGVFQNYKDALRNCVTEDHFIGPAKANTSYEQNTFWQGLHYPKRSH